MKAAPHSAVTGYSGAPPIPMGYTVLLMGYGRICWPRESYKENKMSILERTKHCTKRFPCRYRLVMMASAIAIAASIIVVPYISEIA